MSPDCFVTYGPGPYRDAAEQRVVADAGARDEAPLLNSVFGGRCWSKGAELSMMGATAAGRARGITWQQLCAHAASLPGVERGTCFGTPVLYVRKRFLARLKEDGETVAIKLDVADRDVLLEADPRAFYLTDHYRPYLAVLMRLGQVRQGIAVELLEQAWRRAAPKRLVLAHDAKQPRSGLGVRRRRPSRG